MSTDVFAALFSAPVMVAIAGVVVFVLTAWSDRRDSKRATEKPSAP